MLSIIMKLFMLIQIQLMRVLNIIEEFTKNILVVTGEVNAAIGRNTGAKNAIGDILFFIDGDMELVTDFYNMFLMEIANR